MSSKAMNMGDSGEPDEERVRRKAYELWVSEGRPSGREREHWELARELARELIVSKPPSAFSVCRAATLAVALTFGVQQASGDDVPLPPNNLSCDAFAKKGNGAWAVKHSISIDVGNAKNLIIEPGEITPKTAILGGVDLYVPLESKCGKSPA
jgi:hypothetical protein